MPQDWWEGLPRERYWLEVTDRDDLGTDLRAPLADSGDKDNWRYTLFRRATVGDIVFHYDSDAGAIVSRSIIAGPPRNRTITWAARGTSARTRNAQPAKLPGYVMPLIETKPLERPITLEEIRAAKPRLAKMVDSLRMLHGRAPLYFPFELSSRPIRPLQAYAFKLPAAFVDLFLPAEVDDSPELTISHNAALVAGSFRKWRRALLDGAVREAILWRQPAERLVFSNQLDRRSMDPGPRTALGIDPTGEVWAVQINEAEDPGDPNVASAIATDGGGRRYLLRQGRLNPNRQSRETILYDEFARLTGLRAARVVNGDTDIKRDWYVVTPLDLDNGTMLRNTARFVDACVIARTRGKGTGSIDDLRKIREFLSNDEAGGTYTVGAKEAVGPKEIERFQGEVWQQMAALLRPAGATVEKPRHAAGYEVDAEIVNGSHNILVEIKSSSSAPDVYSGLGQLMLYRKIFPRLEGHLPVLLLPELPGRALAEAVVSCGVTICTFDTSRSGKLLKISFSQQFLRICGVGMMRAA